MSRSCPELAPRSSSPPAWQVSPEGCRSLDEAEILGLARQEVNDYRSIRCFSGRRSIGDAWISRAILPVLRVPSAVIPAEYNFLLNPSHKDFEKLRIGKPQRFQFDRRLTDKP
jgi:RES domain-containing protein